MAGIDGSALEQYFTKSFETKLLVQMPEEDTQLTPATRLLAKRREMAEVEGELINSKERFSIRMEKLNQRKEKLAANEKKLSQSLQDYDKYLRENDIRRKRALKKAKEELALCEAKDAEITQLRIDIKQLRQEVEEQREDLADQEVYEKYLKGVLSVTVEFREMNELIDRHATLAVTNKELLDQQQDNQKQLEQIHYEQERGREAHQLEVLRLQNQLAQLEGRYENVTTERLYWENQAKQVESTATKRTLLLGRIKMATANLYALVESRAKSSQDKIASTDKQLDKVKVFIQDQQEVYGEYQMSLMEDNDAEQ